MSVNLSLYPYPGKWPKKAKTFKPKREFEFRNFYDFYDDLSKLPKKGIPDSLRVVDAYGPLTDSGNNYRGEEDQVNYYKAGDVAKIFKFHMKLWDRQLKKRKDVSSEEKTYYRDYMKMLKQISRLKPSTPLIVSYT